MKRMKASNLSKSTGKARDRVIISAAEYKRLQDIPNIAFPHFISKTPHPYNKGK